MSARLAPKVPVTVVTGFLGAGKTSLIRNLLMRAGGRRLALVINEFGELGIDRELIAGCGIDGCDEDDIVELTNGCICCTVADEFLPTIERLLERPEPPDHIVIETSGLALPKPLVKAFDWPEIRSRATVDGVIAVVDAAAVAAGRLADDPAAVAAQRRADDALDHDSPLQELFDDQLGCADMVVLNKADLVHPAALSKLCAEIGARLRPAVRVVTTAHGALAPAVLLGLEAAAEDDLDCRPSHHDDGAAHDHDDFESFTLTLPPITDPAALVSRLEAAAAAHHILRVKGFVEVPDKPMRHVVQGVGGRFQNYYDRPWRPGETRVGRLVVIGFQGLDRAAITAAVAGS